jgi:hypothetical protein
MKIISIDVGIKNLAYCLLEVDTTIENKVETLNIIKWDSINLCEEEGKNKDKKGKKEKIICTHCKKKASFYFYIDAENAELHNKTYLCTSHSKKVEGKNIMNEIEEEEEVKKEVKEKSANKMDLVSIGIAIKKHFDTHFVDIIDEIDHIVIENQISPIATRMKTIQGMLMQYFIMRGRPSITFASAINKLKAFTEGKKTSYKDRKKLGIDITKKILHLLPLLQTKSDYFITHTKKDDLADSFLQGIWYLQSTKKCGAIKIEDL